jgi:hypothetical protein
MLDRTMQRLNPNATPPATTIAPVPVPGTTVTVPPSQPATTPDARAQQEIDRLNNEARAKAQQDATQRRSRQDLIRELEQSAQTVAKPRSGTQSRSTPAATPPPSSNGRSRVPPPKTPPAANGAMTSKQQRLAELLEAYKADKIGPTEYHKQRAKILAEP